MRTPTTILLSSLALALAAPTAALAATDAMDPHQQVITLQYQSGGATAAGRARMEADAKANDYDLQVHMAGAERKSAWEDATISVTDETGLPMLSAALGGPLFYARLPQGDYTVDVSSHGQHAVTQHVHVTPGSPASIDARPGS